MGEGVGEFDAQALASASPHGEPASPSSQSHVPADIGMAEDEPEDSYTEDAEFRVGAILGRATGQFDEVAEEEEDGNGSPDESHAAMKEMLSPQSKMLGQASREGREAIAAATAAADAAELLESAAVAVSSATSPAPVRRLAPQMGSGGVPNPQRGAEIAKVLQSLSKTVDISKYADRAGFGRTPPYLREASSVLDAEQEYIISLHEPRLEEAPKNLVRLLQQGERDELLQGLRHQFQQASARVLKAKPRSQARTDVEGELQRIKGDIASLSRPYIFVQVQGRS